MLGSLLVGGRLPMSNTEAQGVFLNKKPLWGSWSVMAQRVLGTNVGQCLL